MNYEDMCKLYELLGKFENYTLECKANEHDANVLQEIAKTQSATENIKTILALEF